MYPWWKNKKAAWPTREEVDEVKARYKKGQRVICLHMQDPYGPVPDNTKGTITDVDDIGQIHAIWDNGSTLAFVLGLDKFEPIEEDSDVKEAANV